MTVILQDPAYLLYSHFVLIWRVCDVVSAFASNLIFVTGREIDSHRHINVPAFLQIFYEVGFGDLFEFVEAEDASVSHFFV